MYDHATSRLFLPFCITYRIVTRRNVLGEFEQIVLLAVAHLGEDGYGMTIRREIQGRTGRDVTLGPVYSTLSRLEEKGFVESWTGDPTPVRGGRATRHYRIQPEGIEALRQTRAMFERMWRGVPFDPRPETT